MVGRRPVSGNVLTLGTISVYHGGVHLRIRFQKFLDKPRSEAYNSLLKTLSQGLVTRGRGASEEHMSGLAKGRAMAAAATACALAAGVAACGSDSGGGSAGSSGGSKSSDAVKVGLITKTETNPFFV